MKIGDIVSVVAMSGEYIGELVSNENGIELSNPKIKKTIEITSDHILT